jgi:glycosyltransferase involved in cell wall biosynthesis
MTDQPKTIHVDDVFKAYLEAYPEVSMLGLSPVDHYLTYGRRLGYSLLPQPRPPLPERVASAPSKPEPAWLSDVWEKVEPRLALARLTHALAAHARAHGRFTHAIVSPFFGRGGAEQVADNLARAISEHAGGSVLMIASDTTLPHIAPITPPPQAFTLDLGDWFRPADLAEREAYLLAALRVAGARRIHFINSEVGWRLVERTPRTVRALGRLYSSFFAFQFDWETGRRIGYAETFLRAVLPHMDGLLSDNRRFLDDARSVYGLEREAARLHVLYNPVRMDPAATAACAAQTAARLRGPRPGRPCVLWAGRLDREKRPELLAETARLRPDIDFHVYGARVVDADTDRSFQRLPNVKFRGGYDDPVKLVAGDDFAAFMFTSRWEGLPNVVLEFGALGLPVVAALVGGLGEVIDETTGWPLAERPTAQDYAAALDAVIANPGEAADRADRLRARLAQRHTRAAFSTALAAIPGYFD